MPHVRCHYGQIGHVKRFYPLLNGSRLVGQPFSQPRALVQGFGRSAVRPMVTPIFKARSSFGAQGP